MSRNSRFTERRSMRISVQKYIDQNAAQELQRRQLAERARDAPLQQAPVEAPAREIEPAASNSSARNGQRPRLPRVIIPRPRRAEAPRPSNDADARRENAAPNQGNRNERPEDVPRNEPPAPVANPPAAAVERVPREPEAPRERNIRNDVARPENPLAILPRSRNDLRSGRDSRRWNPDETYDVDLSQRILSDRDEATLRRLRGIEPLEDFNLIALEGSSFPCTKELLRNMFLALGFTHDWSISKLHLGSSRSITEKIAKFAQRGTITIDDHCIFDLMGVADYLGFEGLMKVCVAYASRLSFRTKKVVEVYSRFHHVDGVKELFFTRLDRMPIHLYYPRTSPDESLLLCLSFDQLREVLARDSLVVTSEDKALQMIVDWLKHNEVSEEQKAILIGLIRYPFLTRAMAKSLKDGTLGLPMPKNGDVDRASSSCARTGHDYHVHIMWGDRLDHESPGPNDITVSCITWNKHFKNVNHRTILKTKHVRAEWEDTRSVQYAVFKDKLYKAALGRDHDEIMVDEVNLYRETATTKYSFPLAQESIVDNHDPLLLTGSSELKVVYWDRGSGIVSLNTNTWERVPHAPLARFPIIPMNIEIFKDYAVGHTCRTFIISNAEFQNAVQVELPESDGDYTDFVRLGNFIYLLEDNSQNRVTNRRLVDLVHCIDLTTKRLTRTMRLPTFPEPEPKYYKFSPKSSLGFIMVGSEPFIIARADFDLPYRIYSFDVETGQCRMVVQIPNPDPVKRIYLPDVIVHRHFLCVVPPRLTPCDRATLKDLGESFVAPGSL